MRDSQAKEEEKYELIKKPTFRSVLYFCFFFLSVAFMGVAIFVDKHVPAAAGLAFLAAVVSVLNGLMIVEALKALQRILPTLLEDRNTQD